MGWEGDRGENRRKWGGNRANERVARVAKGRKSGERGYSDKEEGSAGCVELLRIKEDFCNITNCESKMAEKLRHIG